MLWKKGRGVLTAPQYIKLAYGQGIVHVEAFTAGPSCRVYTWAKWRWTTGSWGPFPKAC